MKKPLSLPILFAILLISAIVIYGCGQVAQETGILTGDPWIIFAADRGGQEELYKIKTDGSEETRLTVAGTISAMAPSPLATFNPAISPDGSKIAYVTNKDDLFNDTSEIYVANLDGTNVVRLTTNSSNEYHPTWSSDGTWIAFYRYYPFPYDGNRIFKIKSDGTGGETALSVSSPGTLEADPDWSHDGTRIAFGSTRNPGTGGYELYTMEADGTNQILLFGSPETWSIFYPRWSPDGSKILVSISGNFSGAGNQFQLFTVDTQSPNTLTRLTNNSYPVDDLFGDWSEDGAKIIFVSDRDINSETQIYIMNADGSNPVQLTTTPYNKDPVWKKP
jgi:Tol biopolymer transport system component